ncbi:MAG: hypothetical protein D6731_09255 [Planctomycetota bacterium]|nr:MAG: hypothetical protein D6731_09255 [Planctomycetota bacterium]
MKRIRLGAAVAPFAVLALCAVAPSPAHAADVKGLTAKLRKGLNSKNDEAVRGALEGLIDHGGEEALRPLLKLISKMGGAGADTSYWQLVHSAGGFRDRPALEALADFIIKKKKAPYARDLLFALENNPSPNTAYALAKVLEKGPYDLQLMAADQLAQVATTASVDALVAALEREGDKGDPALRRRIMAALATITKENMGDALNWIGWWKANRSKGLPEPEDPSERAGGTATTTLNKDRGRELESVRRNPNRIIVLSARRPDDDPKDPGRDYNYDHMEGILTEMKIPHKVVLKEDFEEDPQKYLREAWTLLINCNNIQEQCICKECRRILAQRRAQGGSLGPKKNRLYGCPPDCPQGHDRVQYRLSDKTVQAIKRWVEAGGYLFTEDWGVVEVVEVAWPKLVTSNKRTTNDPAGNPQVERTLVKETVVPIMPGRGMTSRPLLRGVFTRPRPPAREDGDEADGGTRTRDLPPVENPTVAVRHKWKIDDESPSIHVVNPARVDVLMLSDQLGQLTGGDKAVAVNFRVGRGLPPGAKKRRKGPVTGGKSRGRGLWSELLPGGSVLHCISHFGKQQHSRDDTFVLQNLILNFIMESNRQHGG